MSSIINHDAESIYNDFLANIENEIGEPLYPGDERRIFAEAVISVLVSFLATADDKVNQSRLQNARGEVLDAIGDMFGVARTDGVKASANIKFMTNTPVSVDIVIPAGTMVTNDYEHYFVTLERSVIVAGDTEVTAFAEAVETGEEYNNIGVGEIDVLTTSIAYIDDISNVDITSGGANAEDDDTYRDRIQLSMDRFAAGTENYYKYIALTANNTIKDVYITNDAETYKIEGLTADEFCFSTENAVTYMNGDNKYITVGVTGADNIKRSRNILVVDDNVAKFTKTAAEGESYSLEFNKRVPGTLLMYLLCQNGTLPSDTVVEQIERACNDDAVRNFNDRIIVRSAVPYEYQINVTCYISPKEDVEGIKTAIAEAVENYKQWQSSQIGKNINKDRLQMYLMMAGAYKVTVVSPSHRVINDNNVAVCTNAQINYIIQEES